MVIIIFNVVKNLLSNKNNVDNLYIGLCFLNYARTRYSYLLTYSKHHFGKKKNLNYILSEGIIFFKHGFI